MRFLPVTVFIVSICFPCLCFNDCDSCHWLYIWAKKSRLLYQVKVSKLVKFSLIRFPVSMQDGLKTFVKKSWRDLHSCAYASCGFLVMPCMGTSVKELSTLLMWILLQLRSIFEHEETFHRLEAKADHGKS